MAITTYKLNNDERATIGGGYTHVARCLYSDLTGATDAVGTSIYTLRAGDFLVPQAAIYVKTPFTGGSAIAVTLGTSASGGSQTVNVMASKDLYAATTSIPIGSTGPTSTTEIGKPYAASTILTIATTITGTFTAGEIYIFFTVAQLGTVAGNLQF